MFKQTVLVSLVIFSAQCVQASQKAAAPMPACPAAPARVKHLGRRQTDPNFGAAVHQHFAMGMWASDNSTAVPSVLQSKLRAKAVILAIAASNEALAHPAK